MTDYTKPVVFKIGEESYGVDINLVQSIENGIDFVPVPNAVEYVKGIVNLRGEVIPVYSLKRKFNIPDDNLNGSCVIISAGDFKIALEVDEVLEISEMKASDIVRMPIVVKNPDTEFMDRVANIGGRLVILMDVMKLLTREESAAVKKLAERM